MTTARELLSSKPFGGVITVDPGVTVRDACSILRDRNVGSLVVFDGVSYNGIFTERDVVKRVVAEGLDPVRTLVGEVMTPKILSVRPEDPVELVEATMRRERIRHLVVLGDAGVVGVVSLGDVAARRAVEDRERAEFLTEYVFGRS
ncbi:MAG: CBS domain-containing protein [Thermoanaerobaculia bacterium]